MFAKFTDKARRAVVLAQEEARLLGHHYIGTEHLLLALVHEPEGVAGEALASAGVTLTKARERVSALMGERGAVDDEVGGFRSGQIPFTPDAKRALERALNEATRLGDNYIGTGHMLLSLLRQPDGVAAPRITLRRPLVGGGEGVGLAGHRPRHRRATHRRHRRRELD